MPERMTEERLKQLTFHLHGEHFDELISEIRACWAERARIEASVDKLTEAVRLLQALTKAEQEAPHAG